MRIKHIMANLQVADLEAAKGFYTGYLGLSTEEFNMGWVARYTSPDTGAEPNDGIGELFEWYDGCSTSPATGTTTTRLR